MTGRRQTLDSLMPVVVADIDRAVREAEDGIADVVEGASWLAVVMEMDQREPLATTPPRQ